MSVTLYEPVCPSLIVRNNIKVTYYQGYTGYNGVTQCLATHLFVYSGDVLVEHGAAGNDGRVVDLGQRVVVPCPLPNHPSQAENKE